MSNFISTTSGLHYDFESPTPDQIRLEDIAVALGNTCRYGGHAYHYYSVAEHAVFAAELVSEAGFDARITLHALHHDDHEAYIGDWPTPLKNAVKAKAPGLYEGFTEAADRAICAALGLDQALLHHDAVRAADYMTMQYEALVLKHGGTVLYDDPWRPELDDARKRVWGYPPESAAARYLRLHATLVREVALLPADVHYPTD